MVESTAKAIRKANSPPRLFKMEDGQTLVRINYTPKAGDASKHILDRTAIFAELSTLVKFFKPAGEGGRTRNVAAPPDIVSYYQGVSPAMLPLPTLSRVVYHPIFSADGDYHSKDGYDISTSAFLDMTIRAPRLPKVVTEDDLLDAWEWLFARPDQTEVNDERCGLFGEFPFHDDEDPDGHSSRINWLACMIQPLVRDMIDGPTPMHLIDKPTAGSGSSLMATLVNTVLTGNQISMAQYKNNADEFEKALVSKLLKSSDGFMYYDNVNSRVDNGALASAITAGVFSGRLLGQSKELSIPIRHVWLISGNNVSFSSEMIRRLIPTRIDPKLTNPEERKNFRIKHPERWANQHREDLLWALCIFVKNWIDKGMKPGSKSLGSFEAWAGIMSGIFEAADIPEMHADMFLENINTYKAVLNSDSDADVSLLTAILDDFGDKPFTTGEIFEMLWDDDARDLEGVSIPLNGIGNKNKMKQSFGYYVRRIRDRVYTIDQDENGNKINAMIVMSGKDAKTRSPRYRIEKIRA